MSSILSEKTILLDSNPADQESAIRLAGELLVSNGYVEPVYIEAMLEREKSVSTFMGNALAIPHGTEEAKKNIIQPGISIVRVPQGVEYGEGNIAKLVVGIAGKDDEHLQILSRIAIVCGDLQNVEKILAAETKQQILDFFKEES